MTQCTHSTEFYCAFNCVPRPPFNQELTSEGWQQKSQQLSGATNEEIQETDISLSDNQAYGKLNPGFKKQQVQVAIYEEPMDTAIQ